MSWPSAEDTPHNEGDCTVREVLLGDFFEAAEVLVVTGYASLQEVVHLLAKLPKTTSVRLLFGHEPYSTERDAYSLFERPLEARIRDYWLEEGVSIEESAAVLAAITRIREGRVAVRIGRGKPMHAKVYATPAAITIGSSNYTPRGLGTQTEGNARFTCKDEKFGSAEQLAEGLWENGKDWLEAFVDLLHNLLKEVTWQEALARGCAVVLEGEWAKAYVPAYLDTKDPLWPHQRSGLAQALHILFHLGSVLVADATGSGKTRMGAWALRGLHDHLHRNARSVDPTFPAIISPPAVLGRWEDALDETSLSWQVYSHGPLSSRRSKRHDRLLATLRNADVLAVDEAHNFLNSSARTRNLQLHVADHVVLFTATPINRGSSDLLALVELLGPDNFEDEVLDALAALQRYRTRGVSLEPTPELELLKRHIRSFMVRRTRGTLNRLSDLHENEFQGRRAPRYPEHRAAFYETRATPRDLEIAREIRSLSEKLVGITRTGKVLEVPKALAIRGVDDQAWLESRLHSAAALARYAIFERLRSSRLALLEHVVGADSALEMLGVRLDQKPRRTNGDTVRSIRQAAGDVPEWRLDGALKTAGIPRWLHDERAHEAASAREAALYRQIAELATQLSSEREEGKLDLLQDLCQRNGHVLAFDVSVLTLTLFAQQLRERGVDAVTFTGRGGRAAKRRAEATFGRESGAEPLVALCTDAFSEGMNLQGAATVVHLDTPTVIRTAEQRAGRVDRMDSEHEAVEVWWPKDPPELAASKRALLKERHEVVVDLIGANLELPDEPVDVEELHHQVVALVDSDLDGLFDAFRPIHEVVEGLIPAATYERMRGSQADVVAAVSVVQSETAWAFFAVGSRERAAPRWVYFPSPDGPPAIDFEGVAKGIEHRLDPTTPARPLDDQASEWLGFFVERLGTSEDELLPPRRRRALALLGQVLSEWQAQSWRPEDAERRRVIHDLMKTLRTDGNGVRPDPRELADRWLVLLRPYRRALLERRNRRSRPTTLADTAPDLVKRPLSTDKLEEAFGDVPLLPPVGKRIVAAIIGVPSGGARPGR